MDAPVGLVDAAFASLSDKPKKVERRAPTAAITSPAADDLPDDWYDAGSQTYLVQSSSGAWRRYNETSYKRVLKSRGFSAETAKNADLSAVDLIIVGVQDRHAVDYVGRLAGWRAGVHTIP